MSKAEKRFWNGITGREEMTLEKRTTEHELNGRTWTEERWEVWEYGRMGAIYSFYHQALADYEARVSRRLEESQQQRAEAGS